MTLKVLMGPNESYYSTIQIAKWRPKRVQIKPKVLSRLASVISSGVELRDGLAVLWLDQRIWPEVRWRRRRRRIDNDTLTLCRPGRTPLAHFLCTGTIWILCVWCRTRCAPEAQQLAHANWKQDRWPPIAGGAKQMRPSLIEMDESESGGRVRRIAVVDINIDSCYYYSLLLLYHFRASLSSEL